MKVLRPLRCFHAWNKAIASAIVMGAFCTVLLLPQAATAQSAAPRPSIVTPIDETRLTTLPGNTHPLARPQYDRGPAPDSQPIRRMLLLLRRSPEQEQALRKLLNEQQSAASVSFHQWLTPQQFGQQFGPADADVETVRGWLGTHGFAVARVSAGKTVIEFSGTAGQVRDTFHTEIHRYVVDGEDRLANASDPQIPEALADVVAGPVSLNNFPAQELSHVVGTFRKNTVSGKVDPLFTFSTSNCTTPCNALGPGDFAKIYDVLKLWNPPSGTPIDGTGQTIAIVGQSDIATSDVTTFRSMFGLPANTPNIIVDGPDPGFTSAQTEGTIDVEWSGAVAKNATIDFVIDESTEASRGVDLAAEYVVDNNLAPVVSESFGICEPGLGNSGNQFEFDLWEQASAQGITAVVASGDSGSAVCDNRLLAAPNAAQYGTFVSGVASTPFDVAAGGTDFDITAANYQSAYWSGANSSTDGIGFISATGYIPETTWNNTCAQSFSNSTLGCSPPPSTDSVNIVAGSGGESACTAQNGAGQCSGFYSKPPWQPIAAGSNLTAANDLSRDVPDISMFSAVNSDSNSFYILCEAASMQESCAISSNSFDFLGVGGTSLAAPTFAGIVALVNQNIALNYPNLSPRQGNANYVLYHLAANQNGLNCNSSSAPDSECTFHDVTRGNNSVPCVGASPACSDTANNGAYGILEQTNSSGVPNGVAAFNAGTGFDLATGLGSVDAYNLVTNWTAAAGDFNPTSTTLCLSTTPSTESTCLNGSITLTHGSPVYVNAAVSPSPGTSSTGQPELLTLIGDLGAGQSSSADRFTSPNSVVSNVGVFPLTGGTVSSLVTTDLIGGSYTVSAHYAGDGTYGASDSSPVSVVVNPEASVTTLSMSIVNPLSGAVTQANSAPYGYLDFARADIVGSQSAQESATGSVTIVSSENPDGGVLSLGTLQLNSQGYAVAQSTTVPVGSYSISASYSGDASYKASTSASVPFAVTPASTTLSITPSSTGVTPNTEITLTTIVDTTSLGIAPTGTVELFVNGTQVSTIAFDTGGNTDANGFAESIERTGFMVGSSTETLTAVFVPDTGSYLGSTSSPVTIAVGTVTLTLTPAPNTTTLNVNPGQPAAQTITVTESFVNAATIELSCAVTPLNLNDPPSCSMSVPSLYFPTGATSTQSATLTVHTTAPSSGSALPVRPPGPNELGMGEMTLTFTAILLWTALLLQRCRRIVLLAALAGVTIVAAGCPPKPVPPSNPGTSAGTYTVTVTATSFSTTQQTTITVNVQ